METYWFGYHGVPQHATHTEPRAYPFTERRQEWITDWVMNTSHADPERVSISGGSMGAWGSTTYALRHPERFAAVYPDRPRTRQRALPSLLGAPLTKPPAFMDGGQVFKPLPNTTVEWTTTSGDSGTSSSDASGLVTVTRVKLSPGKETVLTITH